MAIFMSGFLLSFSLCLDLGIVNIATIKTGIERGFIPSLYLGLGAGIGDMIYAFISYFGVSMILENLFFKWLLWVGGTFILLYMCWNMIRQAIKAKEINEFRKLEGGKDCNGDGKDFIYGIGLALASPSSILWFATVGGSVIASTNIKDKSSNMLFFLGFFIASEVWSILVAFLSSNGSRYMGVKLIRSFSALSSILFLYFAIKIFISGYYNLFLA